jgi:hypothetical protein
MTIIAVRQTCKIDAVDLLRILAAIRVMDEEPQITTEERLRHF